MILGLNLLILVSWAISSMVLASDGVFVCNLLIRPNLATAGCAMRAGKALQSITINSFNISGATLLSQRLSDVLPLKDCCAVCSEQLGFNRQWRAPTTSPSRHPHNRLVLNSWSRAHTDHDESHVCLRRASGYVLAGITVSRCNDEGVLLPVRVQAMVTPCLSAPWDLDFRFQRCRWVHHSFECFALPRCLRER